MQWPTWDVQTGFFQMLVFLIITESGKKVRWETCAAQIPNEATMLKQLQSIWEFTPSQKVIDAKKPNECNIEKVI